MSRSTGSALTKRPIPTNVESAPSIPRVSDLSPAINPLPKGGLQVFFERATLRRRNHGSSVSPSEPHTLLVITLHDGGNIAADRMHRAVYSFVYDHLRERFHGRFDVNLIHARLFLGKNRSFAKISKAVAQIQEQLHPLMVNRDTDVLIVCQGESVSLGYQLALEHPIEHCKWALVTIDPKPSPETYLGRLLVNASSSLVQSPRRTVRELGLAIGALCCPAYQRVLQGMIENRGQFRGIETGRLDPFSGYGGSAGRDSAGLLDLTKIRNLISSFLNERGYSLTPHRGESITKRNTPGAALFSSLS